MYGVWLFDICCWYVCDVFDIYYGGIVFGMMFDDVLVICMCFFDVYLCECIVMLVKDEWLVYVCMCGFDVMFDVYCVWYLWLCWYVGGMLLMFGDVCGVVVLLWCFCSGWLFGIDLIVWFDNVMFMIDYLDGVFVI